MDVAVRNSNGNFICLIFSDFFDHSFCNQLYNTLILEKAILKKELENLEKNHILEKIKKTFSPKKTLICDYWEK